MIHYEFCKGKDTYKNRPMIFVNLLKGMITVNKA